MEDGCNDDRDDLSSILLEIKRLKESQKESDSKIQDLKKEIRALKDTDASASLSSIDVDEFMSLEIELGQNGSDSNMSRKKSRNYSGRLRSNKFKPAR